MDRVVSSDAGDASVTAERKVPLAFLDSSVIIGYLRGDRATVPLFSAEAEGRIQFAVNPIVLQELLLTPGAAEQPEFDRIRDHLRILPVNVHKAELLLSRVKAMRSRIGHSNDILIMSSVDDCDYLVTRDALLKILAEAEKPQVVTPEELAIRLEAA